MQMMRPALLELKTLQKTVHDISLLAALIILKIEFFPRSFPLQPDPRSFCAVIRDGFLEPRMLESLLGCEALLRIVDKDTA